ncbi:MAG: O-antigen ligase family protein [bacterium]|nr:O-antigen ligase family protein [bacterium]
MPSSENRTTPVRRLLIFTAALMVLIGSVVALLGTRQERDFQLRGYVDATRSADLPFRVPRLGVNADLTQYDPENLRRNLELMRTAHIHWVRQEVRWDEIEPRQGDYQWEQWDNITEEIARFPELRLVAVFVNSPEWARRPDQREALYPTVPPETPDSLAAFVRAFAERYSDVIDFYQVWDEPNLRIGWGGLEPRPSAYAALLQAAYSAIHASDRDATVIAAGLAPTVESGPTNISDDLYLEQLYQLGAADTWDAVAAKPYGFGLSPDDRTVSRDVLNFSRIIALREVMLRYGDGQTPLWASHWGWNSLPTGWSGAPSPWGQVTPEQQRTYTLQALNRAEREWPWLGGMTLQHWQPNAEPDDPSWGFALIDSSGTPTSLWEALRDMAPASVATNGLYPPQTVHARYNGIWTFGALGADVGWVQDSRFEFDFSGSDLALLVRQDNYVAHFYPEIDDADINALPVDSAGNPYLLLTSETLTPEINLVPVVHNLPNQQHTLRVTADELVPDEAVNRWPLVGYAVSDGDLGAPYNRQITIAQLTAAVALIAVVVSGMGLPWRRIFQPAHILLRPITRAGNLILGALTSFALMIAMLLTFGDTTPAILRRDSVHLGLSLLTAGLIFIEPGFLLTLVAVLLLFILIFNRLETGLILTIFWSPFFLFPVELYQFAFPLAEILLLLTAGAWLFRAVAEYATLQKKRPFARQLRLPQHFHPLDGCVIALVILGLIALSWSQRRDVAFTEFRTLFVQPALFYLVLRTLRLDRQTMLRLVDALILAGTTVALISVFQFVRGEAIITAEAGVRRLAGVYGSPNNLGLFLGRCIPFTLALALVPLDTRRRAFSAVCLILMGLAVVLSQSAGALFIGIPMAVAVVMLLHYRQKAVLPLVGLALVFMAAAFVVQSSPRFARLFDLTQGTNFYRLRVWESSLNIIADHPVTGLGLDQFLYAFRGTYILPDAWEEPTLSHPHNLVLDFWIRLGIAGVGFLVTLQLVFWRTTLRVYRSLWQKDWLIQALLVGVMGCMANLLAHGLVDNSVFVIDLMIVFMLLLGLSTGFTNISAIDEQT